MDRQPRGRLERSEVALRRRHPLDKRNMCVSYSSMARPPNSRKEDTHDHIVDVAARAIRRDGYAGVRVADVMKEAGLTHGGFYAHFPSRDALLVEALGRAARDSATALARAAGKRQAQGVSAFRSLVETYLADAHLVGRETGCPVAALGCDMPRQSLAVRGCVGTTRRAPHRLRARHASGRLASQRSGGDRHARRHAAARSRARRQRRRSRRAGGRPQDAHPAVRQAARSVVRPATRLYFFAL